jgi:hypothetical protein
MPRRVNCPCAGATRFHSRRFTPFGHVGIKKTPLDYSTLTPSCAKMLGVFSAPHRSAKKGPFMSSPINPYEAPQSPYDQVFEVMGPDEEFSGPWQMDYFGVFSKVMAQPNWFLSCLLLGLITLIPILGAMVWAGFVYESVAVLHRTHGRYYHPFDFGRFGKYFQRGLGFLVLALVLGIAQAIVLNILQAIVTGIMGRGNEFQAILLMLPVNWASGITISLVSYPLQLRSGLMMKLGEAFQFSWSLGFVSRTWLQFLLCGLCFLLFGLLSLPVVVLTCGLGLVLVLGFFGHIWAYYMFDLYRIYLSRGGSSIPFHPDLPPLPVQ